MVDNIEKLYRCYPILKKINDESDNVISNSAQFKNICVDHIMTSNHGSCMGVIFVLQGTIKIQRVSKEGGETNLFNLTHGKLCHEALSCLLNYKSLNIIGKALSDSLICIIPQKVVTDYLLTNPNFLSYMYGDLYQNYENLIKSKEEKLHDSVETRLIKYLKEKKSNIIYATHKEIAFEIDSSREVVSRKLKELENKGYVALERGKIILNDIGDFK